MMFPDPARGRRGQAMVICLIVIGFLTAILGSASMMLLTNSRLATYEQERLSAFYLARSGLETANLLLARDDPSVDALGDAWNTGGEQAEGELVNGRFGLGYWPVRPDKGTSPIVDEERKLNVNIATPAMLRNLSPALDKAAVQAILQKRQERSFTNLAELSRAGISHNDLRQTDAPGSNLPFRALLTVHGSGQLNVNTAPLATLRCVPGLEEKTAKKLIERRRGKDGKPGTEDDRPFGRIQEVRELLGAREDSWQQMERWLTVRSAFFTVRAWGRTERDPATLSARVYLRQTLRRGTDGLTVVEFHQDENLRD
jgi:DNA uptake protein ComE-like DNA-binding protein